MLFDPYQQWLGIDPHERPLNHYRLLGVPLFEANPDVIDAAVEKRVSFLQDVSTGPQVKASQQLLNEVVAARLCLVDGEKKAAYDKQLKAALALLEKTRRDAESRAKLQRPANGKPGNKEKAPPQKQQTPPRLIRAKPLEPAASPTPPPLKTAGAVPRGVAVASAPGSIEQTNQQRTQGTSPITIHPQPIRNYTPSRMRGPSRPLTHRAGRKRTSSTWLWWALSIGGFALAVVVALMTQIPGDARESQAIVAESRMLSSTRVSLRERSPPPEARSSKKKSSAGGAATPQAKRTVDAKLVRTNTSATEVPRNRKTPSPTLTSRHTLSPLPKPSLPPASDAQRSTQKIDHSLTADTPPPESPRNTPSKPQKNRRVVQAQRKQLFEDLLAAMVLWLDANQLNSFDRGVLVSGRVQQWSDLRSAEAFAETKTELLPQRLTESIADHSSVKKSKQIHFVRFKPGSTMDVPVLERVDFPQGFTIAVVARGTGILLQKGALSNNGFAIQGNVATLRLGPKNLATAKDDQLDEFKVRILVVDRKQAVWYGGGKPTRHEFSQGTTRGEGKLRLGGPPSRWKWKTEGKPTIDVGELVIFNRPLEPEALRMVYTVLQNKWFGPPDPNTRTRPSATSRRGRSPNGAPSPFGNAQPRRAVTKRVID